MSIKTKPCWMMYTNPAKFFNLTGVYSPWHAVWSISFRSLIIPIQFQWVKNTFILACIMYYVRYTSLTDSMLKTLRQPFSPSSRKAITHSKHPVVGFQIYLSCTSNVSWIMQLYAPFGPFWENLTRNTAWCSGYFINCILNSLITHYMNIHSNEIPFQQVDNLMR